MPVQPHLGRVGEVGADLDEPGPELPVEDVEVVGADTALGLGPLEPHRVAVGLLRRAEHPLELLRNHDRHHPVAAGRLRPVQVGTDVVELAIVPPGTVRLVEVQDRDPLHLRVRVDVAAKPIPDLLDHRRRGDRLTQMTTELVHLTPHLQLGDVGVQVQPVDARHVQPDMAIEHVVDVHDLAHHPTPCSGRRAAGS
jgi:hypothetical protein